MIVNPHLPNGHVIFCDDVRYELNNKVTLVGIYGTEMLLFGDAPLTLTGLRAVVDFKIDPESAPLHGVIKIIKSGSEEVLCQQDFAFPEAQDELANFPIHPEEFQQADTGLNVHFLIGNVLIDEPCRLKVRAFVGTDEIRLGSLNIRFAPSSEMQPSS